MEDKSPVQQALEDFLARLGHLDQLDPEELFGAGRALEKVPWVPQYVYRVGDAIWSVDIFRGDRVPLSTMQGMQGAREMEQKVQPAFFVPDGEDQGVIATACREASIPIIARLDGEYGIIGFAPPIEIPALGEIPCRVPPALAGRVGKLQNLDARFRSVLGDFSRRHLNRLQEGRINDDREAELLRGAFHDLIAIDERFAGAYTPLELLERLERVAPRGRDHFFHAFHNLLLGCIVLDDLYDRVSEYVAEWRLEEPEFSIEYVWLLTALFHDVGYVLQRWPEMIYSTDRLSGEAIATVNSEFWQRECEMARSSLTGLYVHLTEPVIRAGWSVDPFSQAPHPFDDAMFESLVTAGGHGVGSCMRLLLDLQGIAGRKTDRAARRFLAKHIYLAGLSMMFHDATFRQALVRAEITSLSSRRFPLATLLMYIDSIQDDRREFELPEANVDILEDILVEGDTVVARINLERAARHMEEDELTEYVTRKRAEAQGVLMFIKADGLKFKYPPEFAPPDDVAVGETLQGVG